MKKWNLYEFFSYLNIDQHHIPLLKNNCRVSSRRVRKRVMAQLEQDDAVGSVRDRAWKFGRIPAIVTAAALVVSGSFVTAAAANGGFQNLYDRFFGTGTVYPEAMQKAYAMPEATIENTCEKIGVNVLGIFGNENSVHVALDFYGTNGYTLPEKSTIANYQFCLEPADNKASKVPYSSSEFSETVYENGHLYTTITGYTNINLLENDSILSISANGFADHHIHSCSEGMLARAIGYSNAECNRKKSYSAEDWQRIRDNYIEIEGQYYNKAELIDCGSISIDIPVEYPVTETVTKDIVVDDIPMQLKLTPWAAEFSWNSADGVPEYLGLQYSNSNITYDGIGYAVLKDGTTTPKPSELASDENRHYNYAASGMNKADTAVNKNKIYITFAQPVTPEQITAVYDYDGICLWEKES